MSIENKLDKLLDHLNIITEQIDNLSKRIDVLEEPQIHNRDIMSSPSHPDHIHTIKRPTIPTHKGKLAVGQKLIISKDRPNLFETSNIKDAHKDDIKIDKLLSAGRTPTQRATRPISLIEIQCNICKHITKIHASLISDPNNYVCDGCIRKRR